MEKLQAEQRMRLTAMQADVPVVLSEHPEKVAGFKSVYSAKALQSELNRLYGEREAQAGKERERPDSLKLTEQRAGYTKKVSKTLLPRSPTIALSSDQNVLGTQASRKTLALPSTSRAPSLVQMVKDSETNPIKGRFEDSKVDRNNIIENQ